MLLIPAEYWKAWLFLFSHPFWLSLLLILFVYLFWMSWQERKQFNYLLHSPVSLFFKTIGIGVGVGFILSMILLIWWKPTIRAEEVLLVWMVTLGAALCRMRFACLSYVVGVLSLVSLASRQWGSGIAFLVGNDWWEVLHQFSIQDWLWLVALTHLCEWLLIRVAGEDGMIPIKMTHEMNYPIHGYWLQRTWPIPFILSTSAGGWLMVPVMIGFESHSCSTPVRQQKRFLSTYVLFFALALCTLLSLASHWSPLLWVVALLSISGHEWFYHWNKFRERSGNPLYVSDQRGLKVLAVIPDTPAAKMGIQSGDRLQRLNGVMIQSMDDLTGVTAQAAFLRAEIIDGKSDIQYRQKALYEDDPHDLGIIGGVTIRKKMIIQKEAFLEKNRWTNSGSL